MGSFHLKISSYDAIEKRVLLLKVMKASLQYKYYYDVEGRASLSQKNLSSEEKALFEERFLECSFEAELMVKGCLICLRKDSQCSQEIFDTLFAYYKEKSVEFQEITLVDDSILWEWFHNDKRTENITRKTLEAYLEHFRVSKESL